MGKRGHISYGGERPRRSMRVFRIGAEGRQITPKVLRCVRTSQIANCSRLMQTIRQRERQRDSQTMRDFYLKFSFAGHPHENVWAGKTSGSSMTSWKIAIKRRRDAARGATLLIVISVGIPSMFPAFSPMHDRSSTAMRNDIQEAPSPDFHTDAPLPLPRFLEAEKPLS